MAAIYASLVIKGEKTFSEVPERIRDKVKAILIEKGFAELAEGDD